MSSLGAFVHGRTSHTQTRNSQDSRAVIGAQSKVKPAVTLLKASESRSLSIHSRDSLRNPNIGGRNAQPQHQLQNSRVNSNAPGDEEDMFGTDVESNLCGDESEPQDHQGKDSLQELQGNGGMVEQISIANTQRSAENEYTQANLGEKRKRIVEVDGKEVTEISDDEEGSGSDKDSDGDPTVVPLKTRASMGTEEYMQSISRSAMLEIQRTTSAMRRPVDFTDRTKNPAKFALLSNAPLSNAPRHQVYRPSNTPLRLHGSTDIRKTSPWEEDDTYPETSLSELGGTGQSFVHDKDTALDQSQDTSRNPQNLATNPIRDTPTPPPKSIIEPQHRSASSVSGNVLPPGLTQSVRFTVNSSPATIAVPKPGDPAQMPSLDYDDDDLGKMEYITLKRQLFDDDPKAGSSKTKVPESVKNLPLQDQLPQVVKMPQAVQADFFANMSTDRWEESGDWYLEEFSKIVTRLKNARKEKRNVAQKFEDEVARREELVRSIKDNVDGTVREMRAGGLGVLRGNNIKP